MSRWLHGASTNRRMLFGAVGAAVVVVAALAALTPTVIVGDDHDRDGASVRLGRPGVPRALLPRAPQSPQAPRRPQVPGLPGLGPGAQPSPPKLGGGRFGRGRFGPNQGQGPLRNLRDCLRQQGLGPARPGSPNDPNALRNALKGCLATLPGPNG